LSGPKGEKGPRIPDREGEFPLGKKKRGGKKSGKGEGGKPPVNHLYKGEGPPEVRKKKRKPVIWRGCAGPKQWKKRGLEV